MKKKYTQEEIRGMDENERLMKTGSRFLSEEFRKFYAKREKKVLKERKASNKAIKRKWGY